MANQHILCVLTRKAANGNIWVPQNIETMQVRGYTNLTACEQPRFFLSTKHRIVGSFGNKLWNVLNKKAISITSKLAPPPKKKNFGIYHSYCWWLKSCTSWYGRYPNIYKVLYIPGGAGLLPSTVPLFYNRPWIFTQASRTLLVPALHLSSEFSRMKGELKFPMLYSLLSNWHTIKTLATLYFTNIPRNLQQDPLNEPLNLGI